jgi:hypothetical protein
MIEPNSVLTMHRPDIWLRALSLASGLTDYNYAPKVPLPDGTIFACGGYYYPPLSPPKIQTPEEIRQDRITEIDDEIEERRGRIERHKINIENLEDDIAEEQTEIDKLIKEKATLVMSPTVFVPEGGMEWLLHEVGHWVAATQEERILPNYGYGSILLPEAPPFRDDLGSDREWQAWAFEEVILAPFGASRNFAQRSQRDGVAFHKTEPIPRAALAHIEKRIRAESIALEPWRNLYADWVRWGKSQGHSAPWLQ